MDGDFLADASIRELLAGGGETTDPILLCLRPLYGLAEVGISAGETPSGSEQFFQLIDPRGIGVAPPSDSDHRAPASMSTLEDVR